MKEPTSNSGHSERSAEALSREGEESRSGTTETLRHAQGDAIGRRAFLRAALLGATGWIGWTLLRRSCAGGGGCGGCVSYTGCGLPWKEARR